MPCNSQKFNCTGVDPSKWIELCGEVVFDLNYVERDAKKHLRLLRASCPGLIDSTQQEQGWFR
jgi:hypothetical protein